MSGADHDPSCIFCKIARAEVPAELVHADDEVVAFNDVSPQAPVHILVVPRIHLASVADLGDNEELAGRLWTVTCPCRAPGDEKRWRVLNSGRQHVHNWIPVL